MIQAVACLKANNSNQKLKTFKGNPLTTVGIEGTLTEGKKTIPLIINPVLMMPQKLIHIPLPPVPPQIPRSLFTNEFQKNLAILKSIKKMVEKGFFN